MDEALGDLGQTGQGAVQRVLALAELAAGSMELSGEGKKIAQEDLIQAEDCEEGFSVDGSLNSEEEQEQELEEYFKEIEE
jgi:hypothetical protein